MDTQLIDAYLNDLTHRKYSTSTLANRKKALKRFTRFLDTKAVLRLQDVTSSHLSQYRLYLADQDLSESTLYTYMRNVRLLFVYLEKHHHIFLNPASGLKIPWYKTRKILFVPSEQDIENLLLQPDLNTDAGIRNRALMETAYTCGIRQEELCDLTTSAVDILQKTLRIKGKGNKDRVVPLGGQAVSFLKIYMETIRPELVTNPDEQALWISVHSGKKLSYYRITHLMREYSQDAGIKNPTITVHALRRACATHMLQHGAHPVEIQTLLGHADLKTLSRYLSVTIPDLKKMHERSKPGQ